MAEIFLLPIDIPLRETEQILAFLNSAHTEQEIADRIEIPGEPDIGIKLGQRLLRRRAELDGLFENLEQIYAVPLIGPERFTDIVISLTAITASELLLAGSSGNAVAEIQSSIGQARFMRQKLQDLLHSDQHRYRIEINTIDKVPFLGEIVTLKLQVFDRVSNITQADMPVTLETTWGHLRYAKGNQFQHGSVINARTSANGELTCQLFTPTREPLTESQQTELSNALCKLDSEALIPVNANSSFQLLVDLYQHPLNRDLRAAIDIHYKSRQARLADIVNHSAPMHCWNYEQVLLRVYLHPHEKREKATVLSMAALPLEFRDWLIPWYQIYKNRMKQDNTLGTALQQALGYSDHERGLASHMLASMHSFIASQNGLVGERVAQQVSEEVVAGFATEKFSDLPDNSRTTLLTLLKEAPTNLKADSRGQIGVATQVAVDVGRTEGVFDLALSLEKVNGQMTTLRDDVSEINSRVSSVETVTANVDFSKLLSDINTVNNNLATFHANYENFTHDVSQFQKNYDSFSNSYGSFKTQIRQFDVKVDESIVRIDEKISEFNDDIRRFNVSVNNFNKTQRQLVANVTAGVNKALRTLQETNPTTVVIKPIKDVTLPRDVIHPPVRDP